ncbi:S9 family peptidase, partial [candidate division KSB1 bacterium]
MQYPRTRRVDVTDDYFGTKVSDPYRWLEDDNSEETKAWVKAENEVTFKYLKKIKARKKIEKRLTELWNYEKYGLPWKKGGKYFFSKNDGLQNQSVLYVQTSPEAQPEVLLDPNKLSEDGTVALAIRSVNEQGKYLAYGTSSGGSDWREIFVRDVETKKDLPDHLKWIKFSGASWSKDGKGFYYCRYPEPKKGKELTQQNTGQMVYYHRVNTTQDKDVLVYRDKKHPNRGAYPYVTRDGKYLIITVTQGTDSKNRVYYMDLKKGIKGRVVKLLDDFDASYSYIDNDGEVFYFRTDLNAPRGKIIAVNIKKPSKRHWKDIVPEKDDVLSSVTVVNNEFVTSYMHDAHDRIIIYKKDGTFDREIVLPAIGSVGGISGKKKDTEMFYGFSSYSYPYTIYKYDFKTGKSKVFHAPKVKFDPDDFITKQVFYKSKDGTKIPMFISYRKDLNLKKANPCYLYGYGGFNISLTPYFSVSNLQWMEMGGILAIPNIRGGGEYGIEWYKQGTLDKKQNVFDDFIAAAEYLIKQGYTSKDKLAIGGGSNGGLLVGACMTQRPDLYAAALPAVGVMDMLRYHKFTIGWAWASDYGRSDNPKDFKYLYAYSPYHNLKPGVSYPATLVTTADHDDRVVPA